MKRKYMQATTKSEEDIKITLSQFDTVLDTFNGGKMTKERMIENCASLFKKLPTRWVKQVERQ